MAPQIFLLVLLINFFIYTDAQSIGVCNGRVANNLPSEQSVVDLYKRNGITRMRIYYPLQSTLQALQGTNIELILDVPTEDLQSLTDPSAARSWVQKNIQKYPGVKFRYLAVGNEVDPNNGKSGYVNFILPAMRNLYQALAEAGLSKQIKVSTTTYSGLLGKSYPPSEGAFRDNVQGFIGPIIRFLSQNNLPMLANIYPYFAIQDNKDIGLPYALFTSGPVVHDNGRDYSNLFDAMLDAHYAAQARLGGGNVEIVVSESGWPSGGHSLATPENARTYYKNLIAHVKQGNGTPARPGRSIETYLFATFNENQKDGPETERNFGVFSLDQQQKYQLSF